MKVVTIEKNFEYIINALYYRVYQIRGSLFSVEFYNKNIEDPKSAKLTIKLGRTKDELYFKNELLEYNEKRKFACFVADELKRQQISIIHCNF